MQSDFNHGNHAIQTQGNPLEPPAVCICVDICGSAMQDRASVKSNQPCHTNLSNELTSYRKAVSSCSGDPPRKSTLAGVLNPQNCPQCALSAFPSSMGSILFGQVLVNAVQVDLGAGNFTGNPTYWDLEASGHISRRTIAASAASRTRPWPAARWGSERVNTVA